MRSHRSLWFPSIPFGFAGFVAAVVSFNAPSNAQAQDLNLQSRIQIYAPPFVAQPVPPSSSISNAEVRTELVAPAACQNKGLDDTVLLSCLLDHSPSRSGIQTFGEQIKSQSLTKEHIETFNSLGFSIRIQFLKQLRPEVRKALIRTLSRKERQKFIQSLLRPVPTPIGSNGPQKPMLKVSVPVLNPTYETNVLKTDQNIRPDVSFGIGGQSLVTMGISNDRPWDVAAFSVGEASARYAQNPSKSLDSLTESAAYQFFLGATDQVDNKLAPGQAIPTRDLDPITRKPQQGEFTVDTLLLGIQNTTAWVPTFHAETADLFTPQAVFTRQNIDLSGTHVCYAVLNKAASNCVYADLSFGIGQTFSDQPTQTNANAAAAGTLGFRIDQTDLVLAIPTIVTGKTYETFAGGRRDLVLQTGPTLLYTPSKYVSASLAITYFDQYSSVTAAAWHGWIIQPMLTISFDPTQDLGVLRRASD